MTDRTTQKIWTGGVVMLAMVAACMMLAAWGTGCSPNAIAWRTLDGVQTARNLTAQQLAAAVRAKHQDCLKAHGKQTPEYALCIAKHRKALEVWQKQARPAINSAIQITATALQIAERAKGDKKVDWLLLLKPAICGLVRVARAWGHYYPDQAKAVLSALKLAEGVVCK